MKTRPLAATTLLLVFAIAPLALGQDKAKKPKKDSTADSASASASASAAPPATAAAAEAAPSAAPSESASAATSVPEPPPETNAWDSNNTFEDPHEAYYFIGARYRGTVIPQFIENLFVDDGATVYSNTIGLELDMRKEGHSTIPFITFTDYSLGNTLFLQKGKSSDSGNITMVNSSLKAIFLGLDELYSIPLEPTHKVDYEFGFGVGLGVVFGSLVNNWVHPVGQGTAGAIKAQDGNYYAPCQTTGDGPGCAIGDHMNATIAKVNQYQEPNWFSGGAVPVLYARLSLQFLGVRYKPVKQVEMRFGAGFALTEGFWFQISGDYGLEKKKEAPIKADGPSIERF
jgi:hypothetical protein